MYKSVGELTKGPRHGRMFVPELLSSHRQLLPKQSLGLGQLALLTEQPGDFAEGGGRVRVIVSEHLSPNREGFAMHAFGFGQFVLFVESEGQVVKRRRR